MGGDQFWGRARRRGSFGLAAVLLIALSAAACTVASISPSPRESALPSATATPPATPSGSTGTSTPTLAALWTPVTAPSEIPIATDTPDEYPTDSPTPPLPKGPLPSLSPVLPGDWTGLTWIAIPAGHYPAVPATYEDEPAPNAVLEGWSRGYVEFIWNPHQRTLVPWTSADGLTWQSGSKLDLSAWTADFKAYDADADPSDPSDYHDACAFQADGLQQGPATMLLRGYFVCGGACGGPWYTSHDALWISADGLSWTPIDMAKTFGAGGVGTISGGSSGYIALGSAAGKTIAWVSSDGQAWTQGALPANAVSFSDPVSYAGGFVLPGIVHVQNGHKSPGSGPGCAGWGATDLSKYEGALWWSPDGTTWTRDTLAGTVGYGVYMSVARIDDHTLVADEQTYGSDGSIASETAWVSRDGKTWTRLEGYLGAFGESTIVAGLDHGLIDTWDNSGGSTPGDTLSVINDKLALVTLEQTGAQPWIDYWQTALGPTGLLVTGDGTRFWIGVPTAG